jgi:hypothetical protein
MVRLTLSVPVASVVAAVLVACGSSDPGGRAPSALDRARAAYAGLPLTFVENRGQTDQRVRFHVQRPGQAFYLTREEIALTLQRQSGDGVALALRFLGADPRVAVTGSRRAPGTVNYLLGEDLAGWRTGVPGYLGVVYRELWPGVDLRLSGRNGELKYEFRVRPWARVADIGLAYRGAQGLRRDSAGALQIEVQASGPPAPGPLPSPSQLSPANDARFSPGQSITFDWSDVAGAATYTIEIDDSESFSAPLIVGQTLAFSQLTTSTLPTTRMWWRVRANDGSGTPGSWSGARRFEVKN